MVFQRILMIVVVAIAFSILFVKERITAVLLYGALSSVVVVLFSMYAAPDVALAEASIGLVFTLFLYMVTLQHRGKLWIGFVEVEDGIDALELKVLSSYCQEHDIVPKIIRANEKEVLSLLKEGKLDIAAGAFLSTLEVEGVSMSKGFVETKMLELGKGELAYDLERALEKFENGEIKGFKTDLARFMSFLRKGGTLPERTRDISGFRYAFAVVDDEEELLNSLNSHIEKLERSGLLDEFTREHLG